MPRKAGIWKRAQHADLEVDVQAAAHAVDVSAGAGSDGIDVRGDVVEHEPGLRVEVPVDAQRGVLLTAGTRAARRGREHGGTIDEVQVSVASDELHRPATTAPAAFLSDDERVFHRDGS